MIRNVDLLEARLPVSVLVDDNTGFEAGVAVGGGSVPDVHAHARLLAIGRSGEVGVVGARAVLGVQDDIVGTTATSTVVVDLEVTSNLVEAEGVEQVVVGVRGVEQLGDGSVYVRRWRGGRGGVRENVVVAAATARPVVVEVGSATGRVGLGDGVVATSHGVGGRASTVPAELRCGGVPGVAESRPATFARVVDSPRARRSVSVARNPGMDRNYVLDRVRSISSPINHGVDLLLGVGIDVSQKPVAQDISFNTVGELKLTILLKVHELGLGVLLCSRRSLDNVGVVAFGRLSGGSVCLDRKLKDSDGSLESLNGLDQVALAEFRRSGDLSLEERATEREDRAIFVDLWRVSTVCIKAVSMID